MQSPLDLLQCLTLELKSMDLVWICLECLSLSVKVRDKRIDQRALGDQPKGRPRRKLSDGVIDRCTVRNVTLVGFVHSCDLADSAGRGNLHPAFEVRPGSTYRFQGEFSMARVLVTGANGHIGNVLIRQLIERGDEVVAFVRPTADLSSLDGLELTYFKGDMQDADAIMAAAADTEIIYHLAANYDLRAKSEEDIIAPAIRGAESIFNAAKSHGVKRVVFTSSIVAVGTSTDPTDIRDESRWNEEPINLYYRAKTESERRVHQLATETGIEVVIVNPAMVLGGRDFRLTPSMRYARDLLRGIIITIPSGLNVVSVQDVAAAHIAAADRGRAGERYIIGGDNLSGKALNQLVRRVSKARPVHMWSPRWALMLTAIVVEFLSKLVGIRAWITRSEVVEVAHRYAYYSTEKVRKELGVQPKDGQAVFEETRDWLVAQGELKSNT